VTIGAPPAVDLSARSRNAFRGLAAIGVISAVAGALLAPDRMWANWLLLSYYGLGLGLAGLCPSRSILRPDRAGASPYVAYPKPWPA
jgi:uncharacterized membrane protein HdeD (DUF308 family)